MDAVRVPATAEETETATGSSSRPVHAGLDALPLTAGRRGRQAGPWGAAGVGLARLISAQP
ncbi:hypothetical protein P1P75_02125 [Streptomyces sp. ID05-39B]|uniref:hypothetical protein n=1 Tax=Streptomyces sp. ID05-39B TaxID=3028664 RepID=UPI0029BDA028|nr:hypothetical protein [Streptomyces sp. ID05-39B]MDX3525260.1 hypothetical protein [Streptomyces sp. ID05-39B]